MQIRWQQVAVATLGFALSGCAFGCLVWPKRSRPRANQESDVADYMQLLDKLCPGLREKCRESERDFDDQKILDFRLKLKIDEGVPGAGRHLESVKAAVLRNIEIARRASKDVKPALERAKQAERSLEFLRSHNASHLVPAAQRYLDRREKLVQERQQILGQPGQDSELAEVRSRIRKLDESAQKKGLVWIDTRIQGKRMVDVEGCRNFVSQYEKDYEARNLAAMKASIDAWDEYYNQLSIAERALGYLADSEEDVPRAYQLLRQAHKERDGLREQQQKVREALQSSFQEKEKHCRDFKQCAGKYPSPSEWQAIRKQRAERKFKDPLSFPIALSDARFGVELEVFFTDPATRDPLLEAAWAVRHVVGQKGSGQPFEQRETEDVHKSIAWKDRDGRDWRVQTDLSLGEFGAEIVSPVLSLRELPDVEKVARQLSEEGAVSSADNNAGLHVHVSHPTQSERIVPIVQAAAQLDAAVERSPHRAQEWAKPFPKELLPKLKAGMSEEQVLREWYASVGEVYPRRFYKQHASRYHGINLHALPYMGTFEVRAFDGTLDPGTIRQAVLSSIKMVTTRMYKNRSRKRRRR